MLGLGEYSAFAENDVDLRALAPLSQQDLKGLGVSLGHQRILQQAIATLSGTDEGSSESQPFFGTSSSDRGMGLAGWERCLGERKSVPMLFADIARSTALTEKRDLEEAHELLYGAIRGMCEVVGAHRGTVCRVMGDGVMEMLGAPISYEDHFALAN